MMNLIRSLLSFFFAIFFIISLVVFGNQFVLTVQESIEYGIPIRELMPLVWFNMLRDVPVILSLSLFLSIIITISQLYKNSEAVVMNSIGFSDKNFINAIKPVIIISFLFVTVLTIYTVPWAKYQKSVAENRTVNASEFSFISEGKFESFKNGDIIFYASESSLTDASGEQNMEEIFIYALSDDKPVIVLASNALKYIDSKSKSTYLRLKDGVRYEGLPGPDKTNILIFDTYDLQIVSGAVKKSLSNFSEIEEKNTLNLIRDRSDLALAELQWRISQPISILILSIFGVFLGKTSPRGGKGINLLIGIVVFMIYNNGLLVAKNSIESGQLNPLFGMSGVHLLLVVLIIIFYQLRSGEILSISKKVMQKGLKILIK